MNLVFSQGAALRDKLDGRCRAPHRRSAVSNNINDKVMKMDDARARACARQPASVPSVAAD